MTNEVIDLTLAAIDDTNDQIESLDAKSTKKRADLNERLRLLKQLQSLERQLKAAGAKGVERKQRRENIIDAHVIVVMGVHDPERIASAREFLRKHDPALLATLDAEPRTDDYQKRRLGLIRYMVAECPHDVQIERVCRFLDSVRDADRKLPAWIPSGEAR